MRIAEAAKLLGIGRDTIRNLERSGAISLPRDRNGHRRLTAGDLEILRRVVYPPSPRVVSPKAAPAGAAE